MGEGLVEKVKREEHLDLNVTWMPFELHPDTPAQGSLLAEVLGMPPERLEPAHRQLKARAADLGLAMNPPKRLVNTHKAFMLAEYVRDHQPEAVDRLHHELFVANFVEGRNLADNEVLTEVCRRSDLDPAAIEAALADPQYEERLERSMSEAHAYGINGAPTFIINDRYKIVGAQPYEALRDAFRRIAQEEV